MSDRPLFDPAKLRQPGEETVSGSISTAPLTPRRVNELIRGAVERHLPPTISVIGEIADFSRPASGHIYLTLKDEASELRCVLWRSSAVKLKFQPQDGLKVIATGAIEVYSPRGTYQLVARKLEPVGTGALELAFRQLREKLAREGLFDPARKRPLPAYPQRVGIVTSPTGAAIRDILRAFERRWPSLEVFVFPCVVQGDAAAPQIVAAIQLMNRVAAQLGGIDVAIVGRGGGSLEDLWAFNEEIVARAIAGSAIPIVSGIGHEVDITIADLVADVRAATPTAAAELITPNHADLCASIARMAVRIQQEVLRQLKLDQGRLLATARHDCIARPLRRLREMGQLLDERQHKLRLALGHRLRHDRQWLAQSELALAAYGSGVIFARRSQQLDARLIRLRTAAADALRKRERRLMQAGRRVEHALPARRLARLAERLAQDGQRVALGLSRGLERRRALLAARVETLTACDPKRVLQRGYSLTRDGKTRRVLRSIAEIKAGQGVITELHDGEFFSRADDPRQKRLFSE